MLEMQQKFLNIARQNQLQDDRLKLARRQIDKETNFPINSYVIAEYEVGRKPDNLHGIKIIRYLSFDKLNHSHWKLHRDRVDR